MVESNNKYQYLFSDPKKGFIGFSNISSPPPIHR